MPEPVQGSVASPPTAQPGAQSGARPRARPGARPGALPDAIQDAKQGATSGTRPAAKPGASAPQSIALSLVSHTNVGKTTLARTLLGSDIGEVRDAPHVTEFADEHALLSSAAGDKLALWDTPGFGDSARLLRRMAQQGQPLGWLLSEVWDRWRDRPFWASQQALRNVREQADVVLYLVNAAEEPQAAGYVVSEMDLLAWVGKPVLVLLNQLGAPRPAAEEAAEVERWRSHLAAWPLVRDVLPLDAFARCWVQEGVLLQALQVLLAPAQAAALARLRAAWVRQRLRTFEAAMDALARTLANIAAARQPVAEAPGLRERLARFAARIGRAPAGGDATALAQQALAEALDAVVRAGTGRLIELHGLHGRAEDRAARPQHGATAQFASGIRGPAPAPLPPVRRRFPPDPATGGPRATPRWRQAGRPATDRDRAAPQG